jgi:hypothetical protein
LERLELARAPEILYRGMARFGEESQRQVNKLEQAGESGDRFARSLGPGTLEAPDAGDRASEGWCWERHERPKLGKPVSGPEGWSAWRSREPEEGRDRWPG